MPNTRESAGAEGARSDYPINLAWEFFPRRYGPGHMLMLLVDFPPLPGEDELSNALRAELNANEILETLLGHPQAACPAKGGD